MYIYAHWTSRWPVYIFYLIGYIVRDAGRARRQVLNSLIDLVVMTAAGVDVVSAPEFRLASFVTCDVVIWVRHCNTYSFNVHDTDCLQVFYGVRFGDR